MTDPAAVRARIARIHRRMDVGDAWWLLARLEEALDEIDRLRPVQAVLAFDQTADILADITRAVNATLVAQPATNVT